MLSSNYYTKIPIQKKKSKSPNYNKQKLREYYQIEPSNNTYNQTNYFNNINTYSDELQYMNLKLNFQKLFNKIHRLNNIISSTDFTNTNRVNFNDNKNYFGKSFNIRNNNYNNYQISYRNYNNDNNRNKNYPTCINYQINKESQNLSEIADNIVDTFNLDYKTINNIREQDSNNQDNNSILICQDILSNDIIDENFNYKNNNDNVHKDYVNEEGDIIEIQIKNNKIQEKIYSENKDSYNNKIKKQLDYQISENMEFTYIGNRNINKENPTENYFHKNTLESFNKKIKDDNEIKIENINNIQIENLNQETIKKNINNKNKESNDNSNNIHLNESINKNKGIKSDKIISNSKIKGQELNENSSKNENDRKLNKITGNNIENNNLNKSNSLNSEEEEDLILSTIVANANANANALKLKEQNNNRTKSIPSIPIIQNVQKIKKNNKNVSFNDSSTVKISFNEEEKVNQLKVYNNNNKKLEYNPKNINNHFNFSTSNDKPKSVNQKGSFVNSYSSRSSSKLISPKDSNNSDNTNLYNNENLNSGKNKINSYNNVKIKNLKKEMNINTSKKSNSKEKKNIPIKITNIKATKDFAHKLNNSKEKNKNDRNIIKTLKK
jgi:hypothetical protein